MLGRKEEKNVRGRGWRIRLWDGMLTCKSFFPLSLCFSLPNSLIKSSFTNCLNFLRDSRYYQRSKHFLLFILVTRTIHRVGSVINSFLKILWIQNEKVVFKSTKNRMFVIGEKLRQICITIN